VIISGVHSKPSGILPSQLLGALHYRYVQMRANVHEDFRLPGLAFEELDKPGRPLLARRVNHDGIFWQLNIAQFTERLVTLTVGQAIERGLAS
jgi:hypothetical protein